MKMDCAVAFLGLLVCLDNLCSVTSDAIVKDDVESLSCTAEAEDVSVDYLQKVSEVLDAIETDIKTYSTLEVLYSSVGDGREEVTGSASCIKSKDIRDAQDCYTCIVAARHHMTRLCPKNFNCSVSLSSCSLMFERLDLSRPELADQEEQLIDDEYVPVQTLNSTLTFMLRGSKSPQANVS